MSRTCDWEGCTETPFRTPTSTGHHLCRQHMAEAYAKVRDAQRLADAAVATVQAVPIKAQAAPINLRPFEMPQERRHPLRWMKLGRIVPPVLLGVAFFLSFADIRIVFWWFFLVPVMWMGWMWGYGESSDRGKRAPQQPVGDAMYYAPTGEGFHKLHEAMNERTWER